MKAVYLTGNRNVEVRDIPKPVLGTGKALIKIKVSGICGSDLHTYRRLPTPDYIPFVCGHEPCGVIEEIYESAENLRVGQRVALFHYHGCGKCKYCASGLMQHCTNRTGFGSPRLPGGDAEYMLVNAYNAIPLPDSLSFVDGAFVACIASTAYRALSKLSLNIDKSLCIFGLGPVGLSAVKIAKVFCPSKIIGVDPNPKRREIAKKLGIDYTFTGDDKTVDDIKSITNGGANSVLETSGSISAQINAVECAARLGNIAITGLAGLYDKEGGVNLSRFLERELSVYGSFVISLNQFHELLALMQTKNIHFDDLVTHRFPIEKAAEAFAVFDKGDTGKVIFEFGD